MGERCHPHCHVLFRLRAQAQEVYLLTRSAAGGVGWTLSRMDRGQTAADLWELLLPLPPGRHRFRYYVNDGWRTIYHDPDEAAGITLDGTDAVVDVPPAARLGLLDLPTMEWDEPPPPPVGRWGGDAGADEHRWGKLL